MIDFYHYYDIDLYPADFIEYTSYDHPGMYHRIKHIQEEIITRGCLEINDSFPK